MKVKFLLIFIGFGFCSSLLVSQTWDNFKRLTWINGISWTPKIVVDSNNTVHVFWQYESSLRKYLMYKNGTEGGSGTWSPPKKLNWNRSVYFFAVAVDSKDTLHVVCCEWISDRLDLIHRASFDGGTSWTPPYRITWTQSSVYRPTLTSGGTNDLYVFYEDGQSLDKNIYFKKRIAGIWYPPQQITWGSRDSRLPYAAMDYSNHLHLVYEERTEGDYELYHKKTTNYGNSWSIRTRITYSPDDSINASFDFTPENNVLRLVWLEGGSGNKWVNYKSRDPVTNTFSVVKRLVYYPGDCDGLTIAAPMFNHVHIVYGIYIEAEGDSELFHKKSIDGGATWTAPYRLTWNSGSSRHPHLAYSGGPEWYYLRLVYSDRSTGAYEIYFRRGK